MGYIYVHAFVCVILFCDQSFIISTGKETTVLAVYNRVSTRTSAKGYHSVVYVVVPLTAVLEID